MSLLKKMHIKDATKLLVLNKPENLNLLIEGFSEKSTKNKQYPGLLAFIYSSDDLNRMFPSTFTYLTKDAVVWVAYPKMSSGVKTDINRDRGWEAISALGWHGVAQISINETWSALRFKKDDSSKSMNNKPISTEIFNALILKDDKTSGTYLEIPFDVYSIYGTKAQLRVKGSIDGTEFKSSMAPYGGKHYLMIKKELRDKIGKNYGDHVHVSLTPDYEERHVEVPEYFVEVMKNNHPVYEMFTKLAYTHRKEFVAWIETAKKEETRQRRIAKAIEMIRQNKKIS